MVFQSEKTPTQSHEVARFGEHEYTQLLHRLFVAEKAYILDAGNSKKIENYLSVEAEYLEATRKLFRSTGTKVRYNKKYKYFLVVASLSGSGLNRVAYDNNISHDFNTKLIFNPRVFSDGRTLAAFKEVQNHKNIIYISVRSLFKPINNELIHELSHADVAARKQVGRALDFKLHVGYSRARGNEFYQHLPTEELVTFSDEVYFLARAGLKRINREQGEYLTVEDYKALTDMILVRDEAEELHKTFRDIKSYFDYHYNNLLPDSLHIYRSFGKKEELTFTNGDPSYDLDFTLHKEKNHLVLTVKDPLAASYITTPIFSKKFLKKYRQVIQLENDSPQKVQFTYEVVDLLKEKMELIDRYVHEVDLVYKKSQSLIKRHASAGQIISETLNIFEINKRYLNEPSVEESAHIVPIEKSH